MENKRICPWGEKIWEEKIKKQNEVGVIHGGRFSKSRKITDKQLKKIMGYLDKNVFFKIKNNGKIMDAGVGPLARFSIEFAKRGYKVLGVDISPTTIIHAKKNILKQNVFGIRLLQDDLTKLNKVNEKFDLIFCFGTFGHIPKILAMETLRKFYSKLNKDGFCFVHLWIEKGYSLKNKLKEIIYMWFHNISRDMYKSFYVNCSSYSREEISELLKYSKFRLISEGNPGLFLLKK